jgi:hypothetical protein
VVNWVLSAPVMVNEFLSASYKTKASTRQILLGLISFDRNLFMPMNNYDWQRPCKQGDKQCLGDSERAKSQYSPQSVMMLRPFVP